MLRMIALHMDITIRRGLYAEYLLELAHGERGVARILTVPLRDRYVDMALPAALKEADDNF